MERNLAWAWMSIISSTFHIYICCHHTDIDLTWTQSGVMGNMLGSNYREPTGGDWPAFGDLTFVCWVNGRIKTFSLPPEERPHIKQVLLWIPGSIDPFITTTLFIDLCSRCWSCALAFQCCGCQTSTCAPRTWHFVDRLRISCEALDCIKENVNKNN